MSTNMKAAMKKLGAAWGAAKEREPAGEFTDLEDGVYLFGVEARTHTSGAGRFGIVWSFTVQEGEDEGETQTDFDGLETEDNIYWVGQKMARMGYELPEEPSGLDAVLSELSQAIPVVRGKVMTKDDFTHVRVLKLVEESGGVGSEAFTQNAPAGGGGGDPEPEGVLLEAGMRVSCEEDGETYEGTVQDVDEDADEVEVLFDGYDDAETKSFDDLELLEEEPVSPPEDNIDTDPGDSLLGATVTCPSEDDEVEYQVIADGGETVTLLDVDGNEYPDWAKDDTMVVTAAPEEGEENLCIACEGSGENSKGAECPICKGEGIAPEDDPDEEGELNVGDTVQWESRGKTLEGDVVELEEGGIRVKRSDNNRKVFVKDGDYGVLVDA